MHQFTVWAPAATRVMLHLPALDRREPMRPIYGDIAMDGDDATPEATGWWGVNVPEAGHGTDYAFAIDGGAPRPDPRSPWQPYGVHGPSRVFDPALHPWSDQNWLTGDGCPAPGAVFYELHIGTFTPAGTLDAAIERLDHLVALGVDMVELMPVAGFPGDRGWGYDGVNLYAVHSAYGGPAALQRFVDAAHARGLGVCLDVVYNHLGPDGNYLYEFGPYFTGTHSTPWGDAVNLDADGSPGVRRWIIDNALRWFTDFHLDCLRLDAVHALVDESPRHLLKDLSDEVAALAAQQGRPLGLVAESDLNDPATIEPTAEGGMGMTAQWDDDVHHALHALLTGERQGYYGDFGSTSVLARVLTEAFRHASDYSSFRRKHWGRPIDPARHRGHQFVVALQNHDQIGNRATGDRLTATLSRGRLAAGAAVVLTSAYTPMLFMGEEWGATSPWQFFTSYDNPELAEAVRKGRRAEFASHGWRAEEVPDPQDPATRDRSVLDWSEPESPDHAELFRWYRDLIALRRAEPGLLADDLRQTRVAFGETWLLITRPGFSIAINLGPQVAGFTVPGGSTLELGWGAIDVAADEVRLGPDAVAVLRHPAGAGPVAEAGPLAEDAQ
ncbi:MAG TPA: malto-oligosyltrehalose trehalohydrolase [Kineosporiaceae bacterium]|nr:malto-oligosyltrehalose trehalohydrolase [Kineosporiaceae bacterium]